MLIGLRRQISPGDEFSPRKLMELAGESKVIEAVRGLIGQECIWAHTHQNMAGNVLNYKGLIFSAGTPRRIERESLFCSRHQFGWGIKEIYDIVTVSSLVATDFSDADSRLLKVFKFSEGSADESERAESIHYDAFYAYNFAKSKLKGNRSLLENVVPLKIGHTSYWNEYHPS